jgi:predicted nucleotidyltransferase
MSETVAQDARLVNERVIDYVTRSIVEHFHPERIILFGSQARGDARRDSDLDLCVIMETSERPVKRSIKIASIFKGRFWPMDIVVYTPQEFDEWRQVKGFLIHTIATEGKVLYDARSPVQSVAG